MYLVMTEVRDVVLQPNSTRPDPIDSRRHGNRRDRSRCHCHCRSGCRLASAVRADYGYSTAKSARPLRGIERTASWPCPSSEVPDIQRPRFSQLDSAEITIVDVSVIGPRQPRAIVARFRSIPGTLIEACHRHGHGGFVVVPFTSATRRDRVPA